MGRSTTGGRAGWSQSESARFSNLILFVDAPATSVKFLKYLLKRSQNSIAQVTVPRSDGRLQTLCAVYRREFAATAEQALREGRNKIDTLFSQVPVQVIDEDAWLALISHAQ